MLAECVLRRVMSIFSSRMEPCVGLYTLVSRLNTVVLPAPLGPMSPTISFSFTSRVTPSTAFRPPNMMPRSFTSNNDMAYPLSAL